MRIKEITTLIGAGVLSLAAVMILENEGAPLPEAKSDSGPIEQSAFEDTSSLIEYSLPAPTAEPPVQDENAAATEDSGSQEVFTSIGAGKPIQATPGSGTSPAAEAAPEAGEVVEPLPELSGIDETPIEQPSSDSLAGVDKAEPDSGLSETFINAVAAATENVSPTLPVTKDGNGDGAEPASIIEETPDGFWLRQAKLNDVFQHLAQIANMQFFHNTELDGPTFVVTGQLMNDDPIRQMEELSLMYGITIHQKGNTVYALTGPQLSQLPNEPFRYQLKYLRPSDIEQIKLILQPFLTPGSGIIEFESKTNTLIVMDNSRKLEALSLFLNQIDQPKQQIAIETRILRVTSNSRNLVGVDWSSVLGENGTAISAATSLNSLFNLPDLDTAVSFITTNDGGNSFANVTSGGQIASAGADASPNLVLSPLQMQAVVRALNAGGLAQQESSPTLITEDNEEGLISIIDRIPIITSTVSETTTGQNVTDEVRYKIDEADPVGNAADTREVGVSVSVTPTILPDDTIRMVLRPRSAQVVEYIESASGNKYPRVNESTVTTTARVPNGHSLLIGGFYEEIQSDNTKKVPFLGDLPAVNLLFKSVDKMKTHTSLVFIVTPKLYRPEIPSQSDIMSHEVHDSHILPSSHDYPDNEHPGHTYRTDLKNTVDNSFNRYEPEPPSNLLHPDHPYNRPEALPVHGKDYSSEPAFAESPTVEVRPIDGSKRKGGLFGKVFGGNKQNANR